MATILPPDQGDWGALLGQSLGQGIGQGLMGRRQREQTMQGLVPFVGEQMALQMSELPPEIMNIVLPQQMKQAERQKNIQMLANMYGESPALQVIQPQQTEMAPSAMAPQQMSPYEQQTAMDQNQMGPEDIQAAIDGYGMMAPSTDGMQAQQEVSPAMSALGYKPGQTAMQALAMGTDVGTAMKLEEKAKETNFKMQRELKRDDIERKKYLSEQESKAWDKADPYISDLMKSSKGSRIQNMDLDRMEEIGDQLTGPAWDSFLKGSGFDLAALRSPESSEFEAIKMSFMKDMKKYFGGNVSTREMEGFLKSLPDLSQTPEGRKRIIANMRRLNNISIQYSKAARDVIKNNNGVPPRDIQFKVEKIMKKRVQKVSDIFKKDLSRPVPKFSTEDKIITAMAHAGGSVVGAIPKFIGNLTSLLGRLGS
jgi:hypothetical protein